jgi:O-antigen/teichoic acid export membrane protein
VNFLGQVLAVVVALPTIPFIVGRLGAERFGILSMAWVLLGYFGLFDLGLGRATTKYAAECLGRGEMDKLSAWVWTSLWSQLAFGAAGALITALAVPGLVHHILKISPQLLGETQTSFLILAAALPLVLGANSLRGVLEAGQYFGIVNCVRVPANLSLFLLPTLGLLCGAGLAGIIWLLVLARGVTAVIYLVFCYKLFPVLRRQSSIDFRILGPLLSYGGWVTVSAVLGPLLAYLDRFVIGSMISMSAVGYYTVPSEAINRISIVPGSLSSTIFPAFSSLEATRSSAKIEELSIRSLKALLVMLGPLTILAIAFARPLLRLWLGVEFAARGTPVLQILAAGVLVNSLALVPFGMLQAMGRPDLTAKFHVLEFPFYVGLLWLLISKMGINGAAMAWTVRVLLDAVLLFGAAIRFRWFSMGNLYSTGMLRTVAVICGFGVILAVAMLALKSANIEFTFAGVLVPAFGLAAWRYSLDSRDRGLLLSVFRQDHSPLVTAE